MSCGRILCTWLDLGLLVGCIFFLWVGLMEEILPAYGRAWKARLRRAAAFVRRRPLEEDGVHDDGHDQDPSG